ncbi:MAG: DUF3761 domain-containing protein [Marmoricola sp.]
MAPGDAALTAVAFVLVPVVFALFFLVPFAVILGIGWLLGSTSEPAIHGPAHRASLVARPHAECGDGTLSYSVSRSGSCSSHGGVLNWLRP